MIDFYFLVHFDACSHVQEDEIVAKSAGHSLKVGYTHYDLRDRKQTDNFVVSQNVSYLLRYQRNPELIEVNLSRACIIIFYHGAARSY